MQARKKRRPLRNNYNTIMPATQLDEGGETQGQVNRWLNTDHNSTTIIITNIDILKIAVFMLYKYRSNKILP